MLVICDGAAQPTVPSTSARLCLASRPTSPHSNLGDALDEILSNAGPITEDKSSAERSDTHFRSNIEEIREKYREEMEAGLNYDQ